MLIAAHAKTFKINLLLLLEVFLYLLLDSLGYPLLCLLRIRKGTASLVKSAVCEQITFPLNQLKELLGSNSQVVVTVPYYNLNNGLSLNCILCEDSLTKGKT